jgi:ubiquinone biosynthesis protein
MELIDGYELPDLYGKEVEGINNTQIAQYGTQSYLKQVLIDGFFHADPHPGNIFVVSKECISYIDFGMVGIIDDKTLNFLNDLAISIYEKNVDKIIYLLTEINVLNHDIDTDWLRQDLLYLIHYYYDIPIEKINITEILNEVFRFLRKYKVYMPIQLSSLARTIIILEGTCRHLSPTFSISSLGKDFVKYYYTKRLNPQKILLNSKNSVEEVLLDLKTLPRQVKVILKNLEKNNLKIHIDDIKFSTLEKCIYDLATQLSLSLVLAAMVVGSSLIIASPNINENIWIRGMALIGFFISFMVGILLVIKIVRDQYKNRG